jgi:hypothetical protein
MEMNIDPEVYIDFMDCKNGYKKTRKDFNSYSDAKKFIIETFDRIDLDLISYY